jgi:hypothetical protein
MDVAVPFDAGQVIHINLCNCHLTCSLVVKNKFVEGGEGEVFLTSPLVWSGECSVAQTVLDTAKMGMLRILFPFSWSAELAL